VSPLHGDAPAVSLLRDLPRLERALFGTSTELKSVDWQETPTQVFLPQWRERAGKLAKVLAHSTAAQRAGRGHHTCRSVLEGLLPARGEKVPRSGG
jgi:hypothetical protein